MLKMKIKNNLVELLILIFLDHEIECIIYHFNNFNNTEAFINKIFFV